MLVVNETIVISSSPAKRQQHAPTGRKEDSRKKTAFKEKTGDKVGNEESNLRRSSIIKLTSMTRERLCVQNLMGVDIIAIKSFRHLGSLQLKFQKSKLPEITK
jgi:hypothetical protein